MRASEKDRKLEYNPSQPGGRRVSELHQRQEQKECSNSFPDRFANAHKMQGKCFGFSQLGNRIEVQIFQRVTCKQVRKQLWCNHPDLGIFAQNSWGQRQPSMHSDAFCIHKIGSVTASQICKALAVKKKTYLLFSGGNLSM